MCKKGLGSENSREIGSGKKRKIGGVNLKKLTKQIKQTDISFFDKSPQAFFVIRMDMDKKKKTHDFKFVYLNDAFAKLGGRKKEELLNKKFDRMFPESDLMWLKLFYEAAYEEKTAEIRFIPESIGRYLNVACFPIEPGYCGCILNDYSGILNPFYNSVYFANIYVDLEKDIYSCVYLEETMHGSIPEKGRFSQLADRLTKRLVYLDDHKEFCEALEKSYIRKHLQLKSFSDEKNSYNVDFRSMQGGELKACRMTLVAMERGDDGTPRHVRIFLQDITEEKRKDEEHQKIILRANDALRDAYEAADRANEIKIDFLSQMSHDIRTPMNAIIGMAALAETHLEEPEMVRDCLKKITISSRLLLETINEVLETSQHENGKTGMNQAEFELPDLLNNLFYMVKPQVEQHKHELTVKIAEIEHESVVGDVLGIQKIFLNIVSNAVEYTPDGGKIAVTIREIPTGKEKMGCYEFVFEDNGVGMSEEFLQKLFTPFGRADEERGTDNHGSGFGMAITKNIVNRMRGDIKVESEPGKGSKFIVTIYLKLQNRKHKQSKNKWIKKEGRYEVAALIEVDFSGKRILLAEDNQLNREVLSGILAATGADIEEAENGREAVELVRTSTEGYYDIILMDIRMPRMNGYEASKAIRMLGRKDAKKIPIIAMTANVFAEDIAAAREAGMNEHIAKPIDFDKLAETLKKWLGEDSRKA